MWRMVVIVLAAACNGDETTVDATTTGDARRDGSSCATRTCGTTCCPTLAHRCTTAGNACECPNSLVPMPFATIIDQMDTTRQPPDVLGIGILDGPDAKLHALVVGFHPTTTATGTDFALPIAPLGTTPFVGVGYDVNVAAQTTRSTYFASQGTLNLTRRCPMGVAGSITGLVMREQTSIDDETPHPQGCMLTVPDVVFDYGNVCP
jgi:hypothetical protein